MEELRTRIYIRYKEGGVIAVLSNRESFDLLGIEPHLEDNSKFLEIGKTFQYEGGNYIIKNLVFKMFSEMHKPTNKFGINTLSPTDHSEFNCQITVLADDFE